MFRASLYVQVDMEEDDELWASTTTTTTTYHRIRFKTWSMIKGTIDQVEHDKQEWKQEYATTTEDEGEYLGNEYDEEEGENYEEGDQSGDWEIRGEADGGEWRVMKNDLN